MTLLELMVVVVIAGILAALALPNFQKSAERRYWRQAQDLLEAIYVGERTYFFAHGFYYDVDESTPSDWETIHVLLPDLESVPATFSVEFAAATTFAAKAEHTDGRFMTIDQDHVLDLSSWPLP